VAGLATAERSVVKARHRPTRCFACESIMLKVEGMSVKESKLGIAHFEVRGGSQLKADKTVLVRGTATPNSKLSQRSWLCKRAVRIGALIRDQSDCDCTAYGPVQ